MHELSVCQALLGQVETIARQHGAKEVAKNQPPSQVVVRKQDGTIQTEYTYGDDPYPPRG